MGEHFYVAGGEFTQTDWRELRQKAEVFGPYDDYSAAMIVWRGETARRVDDAHHRLFVVREADWPNFLKSIPHEDSRKRLEEARQQQIKGSKGNA